VVLPADRHVGSLDVASRPIKRHVTPITRTHARLGGVVTFQGSPPRGKPEGLEVQIPGSKAKQASLPFLNGFVLLTNWNCKYVGQ
jgi:hypothetical protein